jgi:hypothetical protein
LPPVIRTVTVNGVRLSEDMLQMLERVHRIRIPDGAFWYDRVCGSWGRAGGPCRGTLPAGLEIGGPLKADASDGKTGVFINGRQLGLGELLRLRQIVALWGGRHWLDADSNYGREGEPAKGNLRAKAARVAMWNTVSIALQMASHANSGGGHHGSILSTWDRTGVSVYDLS